MASAPLTIVVGAGISGLSCAYALKKSRQNVLLLEASAAPGGVIRSIEENGYLLELGPQSFSSTPGLAELCHGLGLTGELIEVPHGAPRYVLIGDQLKRVPLSPPAFLASDLLSWTTKFSLLKDAFGNSSLPEAEESIASFVRRKFSGELLDRLVGPFVSGIYAGDPEQLSLRAAFPRIYESERTAGSVIRGASRLARAATPKAAARPGPRRGLLSFRAGNEELIARLATSLGAALRCNVAVRAVRRLEGKFRLEVQGSAGTEEFTCDQLVLATPAGDSAEMLQSIAPAASRALQEISYAPLAVVSLGYKREQALHALVGFGFLAPRSSGIRTLGTVWSSSLFPGRTPKGRILLTSFVGGATDAAAVTLSQKELAGLVHREIAPLLQISGSPAFAHVTTYSRAIPQYNLGHLERLKTIQDAISPIPGLRVIGNYWKGPSIGVCVEHALAVAEEIRIG